MKQNVAILGSGAWGVAIGNLLSDNGNRVKIYGVVKSEIDDINERHFSHYYQGGKVNDDIVATLDLDEAMDKADIVVIAVPSFAIREILEKIKDKINEETIIVNLAKGFEKETKMTVGQYIRSYLPKKYCGNVVSLLGPSFAEEVMERQFTAITASSLNEYYADQVQKIFSNDYFRVYTNLDVIGVEYCSALKNIVALACGIAEAYGYKVNTKSAIITRGMAEVTRFVVGFGGHLRTCYGLAGIGDLVLTCSSMTSRNLSAGYEIGQIGATEFFKKNEKTVEGVFACEIAHEIAKKSHIYSPVVDAIYGILFEKKDIKKTIEKLSHTDLKMEQKY